VVRDYIWVPDMTNALARLLKKGAWNKTLNIGSGIGYSLNEVIAIIESITLKQAKVIYKEARAVDVERVVLDISKLKGEIEFNPIALNEGVQLYYDKLTQ
jgi:UDP-glucose 4-epimerase